MDFNVEALRQQLGRYRFRDLTIEELKGVYKAYPEFIFSMDTYTFKDGSQKDLLNLTGTIPMKFQGNLYNIPICLWILDSHPFAPPLCFLKPTENMGIRVGKHIDVEGRIYLLYLQNWSHPKSTVIGLLREMVQTFEEELPLYSLSVADAARQQELLSYISQVTDGVSSVDLTTKSRGKVTVIGGGDLAIACLLAISAKGVADKTLLLDISESGNKGTGAMDLNIFCVPNVEVSSEISSIAGSKVVVITVNAWSNDQSYIGVLQSNVDMLRGLIPAVASHCPNSVLLVASQPVPVWSDQDSMNNQPCPKLYPQIFHEQLTSRAMEILKGKGQRSWSVGLSVADITNTIVQNKGSIHSASSLAKGYFGIQEEVFLSLPCFLGTRGVLGITKTITKDDQTFETLRKSAKDIHRLQQQLKL
ncbi:ubiquitin-conjugating enzyme E2 variant 3 isoform X2 [Bombina bombina]|uniref:ubiquitin-conjugating enzyme E2 variant 3 isoform X2 n=1 Tax=Bombina bombina TaxID=8345 RepID=UPI00235AC38E|nr:ubiquitin-conjugating enzyme E2 variant 3 isoform X2 [Bombina bombina]